MDTTIGAEPLTVPETDPASGSTEESPAPTCTVVPLRATPGKLIPSRPRPTLTAGEREYVEAVVASLALYPTASVRTDAVGARAGRPAPQPAAADAGILRRWLQAGRWLVDLRTRTLFAAGRAPGTFNIGQDIEFVSYAGWLLPGDAPLMIIGERPDDVAAACAELTRIQLAKPDPVPGQPSPGWSAAPLAGYAQGTTADLALAGEVTIVDVRLPEEFARGHLDGAVNVPLPELAACVDDLPAGPLWLCCGSGYRAAIGAAIVASKRHDVTLLVPALPRAGALA